MSDIFHEDFLDFIVNVNWPQQGIASLHYDFTFESFKNDKYITNISTVPDIGMGHDMENPLTVVSPPSIPPDKLWWSYKPVTSTVQTPEGGSVQLVDRGTYWPRFSYMKNGKQQTSLITLPVYHTVILPLLIDNNGNTSGGAFTNSQAFSIIANLAALFASDNNVQVSEFTWILAQATQTHTGGGSGFINTHTDFKMLQFFNLGKIKSQTKAKKLDVTIDLQGQLSDDINCSWNLDMATWKKIKKFPPAPDMTQGWPGAPISEQPFSHLFNEITITKFKVTFSIDLKTLRVTGTSTG